MTQWLNDSMTQFLPLARFRQFFDFALHQVAFQCADVADVKLAVEVIGLVEEGASQQVLSGFFEDLSVNILGTDGDFVGAGDILAKIDRKSVV